MSRSPVSRAGLNRSVVVRAAADLINAEGVEALTINRLARVLSVQPPSLYNHISGLEQLWRELALLNVRQMGERVSAAVEGRSGPEGMLALAEAYRAYIKEFPELYQAGLRVSGNRTPPDPELQAAEARVLRTVLALVESFGLTGEEAIHAVRAIRSAIHGFATLETGGGFGMPLNLDESFHRLVETILRGLVRE